MRAMAPEEMEASQWIEAAKAYAERYLSRLAINRFCCSGFVTSNTLIASSIAALSSGASTNPRNWPRWRINVISHLGVVFVFADLFVAIRSAYP
jgi:hypothetical protein